MNLVSVVIPCYNAEKYAEVAVRSVMQQSYSNLEIITIDDCSKDNTLTILKQLAAEDSRITVLSNSENIGLVATLNRGINATRGKYIARMDADDISILDRIGMQIKFLEENPSFAMCGGNYILIDEDGNKKGKLKFPEAPEYIKAELLFYCTFCHPTVMIRKSVLNEIGAYKEGLVPAEDYELWLRIAEKFPVANLPEFLLLYRWHGNNITIQRKTEQYKALKTAVEENLQSFGFTGNYIDYHLKFLAGLWYQRTSKKEIEDFADWKKALLDKNEQTKYFDRKALISTFDKYYSLALLSIIKSRENNVLVKLYAIKKLMSINPSITINHFITKAGLN